MKINKFLIPAAMLGSIYGSAACASVEDFYIGADIMATNLSTKEGYGKRVFAKNPTAYNGFIGYNLPWYNLFLEAGYESTKKIKRNEMNVELRDLPGRDDLPLGAPINVETSFKIKSPYFGVGISYPLNFLGNNTSITGFAGLSMTKITAYVKDTSGNGWDGDFLKRKICPMFRATINHSLTEHLDIRFLAALHKMNAFKIKENSNSMESKFKNKYSFGLGLSYNL